MEPGIVQPFVEAKHRQPAAFHLRLWIGVVSEIPRCTAWAILDTSFPPGPTLLLAVVDGQFKSLPRDVCSRFGLMKDSWIEITKSSSEQRDEFSASVPPGVRRPPNQFHDGVKRGPRVLEDLPIAPPVEPQQLSEAELAVQGENNQWAVTLSECLFGPILARSKRKMERFAKGAAVRSDCLNFLTSD